MDATFTDAIYQALLDAFVNPLLSFIQTDFLTVTFAVMAILFMIAGFKYICAVLHRTALKNAESESEEAFINWQNTKGTYHEAFYRNKYRRSVDRWSDLEEGNF